MSPFLLKQDVHIFKLIKNIKRKNVISKHLILSRNTKPTGMKTDIKGKLYSKKFRFCLFFQDNIRSLEIAFFLLKNSKIFIFNYISFRIITFES